AVVNDGNGWEASLLLARSGHVNARELSAWLESAAGRTRERPIAPARDVRLPSDESEWKAAVAKAISEIRAGRYEKVVLARSRQAKALVGPSEVLGRLAKRYPQCF